MKSKADVGARSNRIRFIMFDADLSDGNVSELSRAISQALQPSVTPSSMRRIAPPATIPPAANGNGSDDTHVASFSSDVEVDDAADGESEHVSEQPATATTTKGQPRRLPLPEYLHDLDTKGSGSVSLKDFAAQHPTKKHAKRFLISAMWLKEHGKQESVNANKIYTCYKTLNWPTAINDWDVNLRNHVRANRMRRISPGEYTITPLGEAELSQSDVTE
jgi:hypothetical protein